MLGALLIAVLAALFAALALTAALASTEVAAADGSHLRARAAAQAGLDEAVHLLQWRVVTGSGVLDVKAPSAGEDAITMDVQLQARSGADYGHPELTDPVVRLSTTAEVGRARASAGRVVALVPGALPLGLSVSEDLDAQAELSVEGSGVYVGGCVRGRPLISFEAGSGVPLVPGADGVPCPPDLAHGELWQAAGVHAGAAIVDGALPNDTDAEVQAPDVSGLVALPNAAWLAAAQAHALDPGAALSVDVLHLDQLPPSFPTGEPGAAEAAGRAAPAEGYLVVVDATGIDGGLVVVGSRDQLAVPLTLVVIGDAVLGDSSLAGGEQAVAFRGALVVTGALEVAGPASLTGHLACRRLLVRAPLSVAVPPDWRLHPPLGSAEPRLLARE